MAKLIKTVGIVFFVIAVSCLLLIGCMYAINANENDSIVVSADNKNYTTNTGVNVADSETTAEEGTEENPILLNGSTCEAQAAIWNNIVNFATTSANHIYVRMENDWIAPNNGQNRFGTGAGFGEQGSIFLSYNLHVTLDLNGHTINRRLNNNTLIGDGMVFIIYGHLTLKDSSYDAEVFRDIYANSNNNVNIFNDKVASSNVQVGKITGGGNSITEGQGLGGGIYVHNDASLYMYGGMICNNTSRYGGGIYGRTNSNIKIYDGIIYNNVAGYRGGGIYIDNSNSEINNAIIVNNSAVNYGGGIHANATTALTGFQGYYYNVDNVLFAFNTAIAGGGISMTGKTSIVTVKNSDLSNNVTMGNSAGVLNERGKELTMINCNITNNVSYFQNLSFALGGGAAVIDGLTTMKGCLVKNNVLNNLLNNKVAQGAGLFVCNTGNLTLDNTSVIENECKSNINDGLHSVAGGVAVDKPSTLKIGSNVQIYDNIAHGISSDLRLEAGKKIIITDTMASDGKTSRIGIKLADDYGKNVFTDGYGANNNVNPLEYFFNNDGGKIATISNGEVIFESTVKSEKYDFIYYDEGKRINYSDKNLVHSVNDSNFMQTANGGKLILGKILYNTSINEFLSNIAIPNSNISIFNNKGKLIYDKGNAVEGIDSALYDNKYELAVGTGWKLQTYSDSGEKLEEIYLSVLGDVTGDGRLNAVDITYLRQIANDAELFDSLTIEKKLASLVLNLGVITTADAEIIRNIIDNKVVMNLFL